MHSASYIGEMDLRRNSFIVPGPENAIAFAHVTVDGDEARHSNVPFFSPVVRSDAS